MQRKYTREEQGFMNGVENALHNLGYTDRKVTNINVVPGDNINVDISGEPLTTEQARRIQDAMNDNVTGVRVNVNRWPIISFHPIALIAIIGIAVFIFMTIIGG